MEEKRENNIINRKKDIRKMSFFMLIKKIILERA